MTSNQRLGRRTRMKNDIGIQRKSSVFWYAPVDIKVLTDEKLSPTDKTVYSILCVHADTQSRKCRLKISTIAKEANCSERSVHRSLRILEERGIIKHRTRFSNEGSQVSSGYEMIGFEAACYSGKDDNDESTDCHTDTPPCHYDTVADQEQYLFERYK